MTAQPDFDPQLTHRYFSATCFNKTWEWIDNPHRTPTDDLSMLQSAMTSLWHWTQREDAKPQNLSVGYWQVSRVFALMGQSDNARRYAEVSITHSEGCPPFYAGFAYEALARAEMVDGNHEMMNEYLAKARELAEQVDDAEDKEVLMGDINSIE
ncbi:MAG: hypothetical protein HYZ23_09920 [Chloroflexi bacterium]|nr:hypothetical protein [Chloroflexota bacterium]